MCSIDDEFRDAIALDALSADVVEQLEHSARALASTPRWIATSITATRGVRPDHLAAFRTAASHFATGYGLYVSVEEGPLCHACFFRRDEEPE